MHQQKDKKVLNYFFLLLLVGSINNISLNNIKFKNIENIKIKGLGTNSNAALLQEIKKINLKNIFKLNKKEIDKKISSNTLVEKYNIFKIYPSSLDINIEKTRFLARINNKGKIFLLGSNGKLSKNDFLNNQLPFIFGRPDIDEFLKFKDIIDSSKISYDEIKSLYFFSSKRWDLELKNNKLIRLSKDYTKESLKLVLEFLYNDEFKDMKVIDARIKNQIILND